MWEVVPESDYRKKYKHFQKRFRRETQAVHRNLDTFLHALRDGAKPQQIKLGCIHPEPSGVLAFDQKGGGSGLRELRLYTYPDEASEALYLITLGDKDSQKQTDIKFCQQWVTDFLEQQTTKAIEQTKEE